MRKWFLISMAAPLMAATTFAQQYPSSTSLGSTDENYTDGLQQTNPLSNQSACADPLMAGTPQCTGAYQGGGGGGYPSGGFNSLAPGYGSNLQNRMQTYTDDRAIGSPTIRSSTIPLPPEPLTEFQKFTASTTGIVLPIFGANLFQSVPSTFAPLDNTPVPPDYVIGPDDEVRVRVWGQVSLDATVRVNRSGDIFLPQVGSIHVSGLHYSDLEQSVRDALSKIYKNFQLTADLGRIRAIQVYVTGDARRPGVYTISSLSTLVDALFASGGPSVQGSMRRIELRRNGTTVVTFDLYGLLIGGDKSHDSKLMPGDVIYIPPVGSQAAVLGSVRRPAIYELKPDETVEGAIQDAGNLSALASDTRASLERSVDHNGRQAMEVKLDTAGMTTPMRDGDILDIISLVSKYQKTVTLRGNTANPGRFAWHAGMRLSDLIPDRESLITRDYWWKRVNMGLPAPEFQPVPALASMKQPTNPVDLPQQQQLALRRRATAKPRSATNQQQQNGSTNQQQNSTAAQQNPQLDDPSYYWPTSPENMAPPDVYTPPQDQYDQNQQNQDPNNPQANGTNANGQRPMGQRGSESALAEDENNPDQQYPRSVRRNVVRLSVPDIDWSYAVIERMDPATLKTTLVNFDLGRLVLQHDGSQDYELQPGDIVTVFSQSDIHVPIAEQTKLVRLEGEFAHAGTYSVKPGETLRSLVERAGGLSPNAYLYGSVFTRESTRILQQRRMDESIHAMILQMQRGNLALASSPVSTAQDMAGIQAAQASGRELIAELQQVKATGRVVFTFRPDSSGVDNIPEVPLENGDVFLIPSVPSTVNAVGAIFNQNSFLYRPQAKLANYLQLAGGPNSDADRKRMFIIRANGAVVSRAAVKGAWGNEFDKLRLNPGDTIVVPDKTIKPSALRGIIDWTQVDSQMMFGAVAASVVF